MRGATCPTDVVSDLVQLLARAGDEDHPSARSGDFLRRRLTDARRSTGDQHDLAVDCVVERAAPHIVNKVLPVERPIPASRAWRVEHVRYRRDRLSSQACEVA